MKFGRTINKMKRCCFEIQDGMCRQLRWNMRQIILERVAKSFHMSEMCSKLTSQHFQQFCTCVKLTMKIKIKLKNFRSSKSAQISWKILVLSVD